MNRKKIKKKYILIEKKSYNRSVKQREHKTNNNQSKKNGKISKGFSLMA